MITCDIIEFHDMVFDGRTLCSIMGRLPTVDDFDFHDSLEFMKIKYKVQTNTKDYDYA